MKLSGTQYKQLSQLIRNLFEPGELKRMLMFAEEININNITLADNYEAQVFDVIGDSQRKGWTPKLLNAVREARPQNATLLAFSQQFDLAPINTPARPTLEKLIVDTNSFLDVAKWRTNLGRIERQVCAIRLNGQAAGTGFLLGPDVVMTNYHVVNNVIDKKISPQNAEIVFDFKQLADGTTLSKGSSHTLADDWLIDYSPYSQVDLVALDQKSSPPQPDELDYALLRVSGSPGNAVFGDPQNPESPTRGWLKPAEAPHDFLSKPALFIVQHPKGQPLKLALDTNAVLDMNPNQTRVIYRTNTEPGSSGSPCFDQNWNLVALHHSGDPQMMPTWNEGIPFTAIMTLLKQRGKAGELNSNSGVAGGSVDGPSDDDVMAGLNAL